MSETPDQEVDFGSDAEPNILPEVEWNDSAGEPHRCLINVSENKTMVPLTWESDTMATCIWPDHRINNNMSKTPRNVG